MGWGRGVATSILPAANGGSPANRGWCSHHSIASQAVNVPLAWKSFSTGAVHGSPVSKVFS
ncbi:hypothetical protein DESC_460091 [Desulfosarcina cetonica]|nr:hypothetical protein DESC_460091 [Desulfosarcina cetonica]